MEYESRFLKLSKYFMISFGAWPLELSSYANYAYRIYHGVFLTYYTIFVVSLVIGNKDIIYASSEKQAYVLQYTLTYVFLLWKVVLCQKNSIIKLVKLISEKEKFVIHGNDSGTKTVYENCLKHNTRVFYVVFWGMVVILFLFIVVTYFEIINGSVIEETFNFTMPRRELPLPQAFPFEIEKYFTPVYYFQVSARVIAVFIFLGCDSLLVSIIYFPSMNLKLLGYKYRQFGAKHGKELYTEAYLKGLILEHKEIIE